MPADKTTRRDGRPFEPSDAGAGSVVDRTNLMMPPDKSPPVTAPTSIGPGIGPSRDASIAPIDQPQHCLTADCASKAYGEVTSPPQLIRRRWPWVVRGLKPSIGCMRTSHTHELTNHRLGGPATYRCEPRERRYAQGDRSSPPVGRPQYQYPVPRRRDGELRK